VRGFRSIGGVGHRGRDHLAGEDPVHRRAEVVDVGPLGDRVAVGLLGGHVAGSALDPLLHRADRARLAEVDQLHLALIVDHDVGGLQVRMHEASLVHVGEGPRDLDEDVDRALEVVEGMLIDRLGVDEFHDQHHVDHPKHLAIADELLDLPDVRMIEPAADLVLLLDLLEEAHVLVGVAHHVLQRPDLLGLGVLDRVDRARRALPDAGEDLEARELAVGDGGHGRANPEAMTLVRDSIAERG
jgi:hypothetical protein